MPSPRSPIWACGLAEGVGETMRLDRFLWFARLVKTRTVAQALASAGHLRLNGRPVDRAAAPVRIGAVIAFATPSGRVRAIRVAALPARRGPPAEGRACYLDLLENASQQTAGD
jgi:ribosome-associated heat shock protein Hsp15